MARLISSTVSQRPLETLLEEQGILDAAARTRLKTLSVESGESFEEVLKKHGGLPEETLFRLLAESYGFPYWDTEETAPLADLPERVRSACQREGLPAIRLSGKNLLLATAHPNRIKTLQSVFAAMGFDATFQVTSPSRILAHLRPIPDAAPFDDLFSGISNLASTLGAAEQQGGAKAAGPSTDISASLETPSVIELVNKTILLALTQKASDIHVETTQSGGRVRFRIDGVLADRFEFDAGTITAFISRLLIVSQLDITEKVMPQDGSFKVTREDRDVELRIACIPGIFGQNIVLRLLSGSDGEKLNLSTVGMMPDELALIETTTRFPHGMVLVAGPTGSGKSTTLYGVLESVSDPRVKVITIEDPVERRIKGVQQIQVRINRNDPERSLTFARGLRTILRLDPDIIMVGEIRDPETAQISIQASLTGHLVLSTIHANSSVETLHRLENIGIDFHLMMSSLNLIFSQRLLRKLCQKCRVAHAPTAREATLLRTGTVEPIFTHKGCFSCMNTGYSGRIGIFEFLPIDDRIRDLVAQNGLTESMPAIRESRIRTLLASAMAKIAEGVSDFDELERVCGPCR